MAKPPTQADGRITSLALALIDLRADFEAQLRAVVRAEEALVRCRTAKDPGAFGASAKALRDEVQAIFDNNRSVRGVIEQMSVDAREVVSAGKQR
jgi:hypothetical protein